MNNNLRYIDVICPKCHKRKLFINSLNGLTCEGFLFSGNDKDYKGESHECAFSLYPKIAYRQMSIEELTELALNKRIEKLNGFSTRDGSYFYHANLALDKKCNVKIEYLGKKKSKRKKRNSSNIKIKEIKSDELPFD